MFSSGGSTGSACMVGAVAPTAPAKGSGVGSQATPSKPEQITVFSTFGAHCSFMPSSHVSTSGGVTGHPALPKLSVK